MFFLRQKRKQTKANTLQTSANLMIDTEMIGILSRNITAMMMDVARGAADAGTSDGDTGDGASGGDGGDGGGGGGGDGGGDIVAADSSSVGKIVNELTNHVFVELTKAMIARSKKIQRDKEGSSDTGLSAASKSTVRMVSADVCTHVHAALAAPSTQQLNSSLRDASLIFEDLEVLIRGKKTSNALACVAQLRAKLSLS